ncbi:MAG TPA: Arc family DNA-binding protein [Oceanospirillales bacterium]|nr:Arc family DNA-binding protein [Oceanospirillales bacterium]
MAKRKSFPLRINEELLKAVQGWAVDDLRSVNAQLEFIIREALWKSGRLKQPKHKNSDDVTKS